MLKCSPHRTQVSPGGRSEALFAYLPANSKYGHPGKAPEPKSKGLPCSTVSLVLPQPLQKQF